MKFPCLAALALFSVVSTPASTPRPDIVVFLADDLSIRDCSPFGGREIPTPNMDALARSGLTFERAYVASPSCAPSRAALLTGRYPIRNGVMFNHQRVREGVRKWPSYFQALSYQVVAIGKVSHYNHVTGDGFDHAAYFNYHQDICVEKSVEWLAQRRSKKPLCLFVGTNWPHVPWPQRQALEPSSLTLPAKLADTEATRLARARYAAAVENADRDLGLVREAVKRYLPKNTLFVFTADHGSQFPFGKWNLYEAGLNAPMIVSWPGHVAAGQRTEALVSWIDLLPTLLAAAGADPRTAAPDIDGRSFMPVLLGESDRHRDLIFATHSGDGNMNYYPTRSVTDGRWKYIRNLEPEREFHTHVDRAANDTAYWPSWVKAAESDPKIAGLVARYHRRPAEELYDLEHDPEEVTNLAERSEAAKELDRMRAHLDAWMKEIRDEGAATDHAMAPEKRNRKKGEPVDP